MNRTTVERTSDREVVVTRKFDAPAHLVFEAPDAKSRLHDVTAELRDRFGIGHSTLQVETDADAALCRLRPHDVV